MGGVTRFWGVTEKSGVKGHQKSKVLRVSKKRGIWGHQERRDQGTTDKLGEGSPLRRVGQGSESSPGSGVAGKGGDKPPRSPRPRPRNPGNPGQGAWAHEGRGARIRPSGGSGVGAGVGPDAPHLVPGPAASVSLSFSSGALLPGFGRHLGNSRTSGHAARRGLGWAGRGRGTELGS